MGVLQLHVVVLHQLLILLHQSIFGLSEDLHHLIPVQRLQRSDDGHTAHQLGDDAELQQVLRLDLLHELAYVALLLALDLSAKAQRALIQAALDDLIDAVKGTAADEQNVLGIDLDKFLVGVLPAALRRHIGHGTLQDLQQRLLDTLAGHVAGDGGVLALTGDLIHLINIDDAPLGQLDVVVSGLDQTQQDVLHVVAHVARLGKGGGVGDGEGHLQHPGQGLGKQSLAAAGGAHEQDVALLQLHILRSTEVNALIVVVHRHGQGHLGLLLADDILVQHSVDLPGRGDGVRDCALQRLLGQLSLVLQDAHAQLHTLIADISARPGDEAAHLILMLSAEGTADRPLFVVFCHETITSNSL